MDRAYSVLEIKAVDDDARVIEGMATTPEPDRVGDIVEPMGAKFKLPMPLLWMHRSDEPVGHVEFAKPTKNGIPFKARMAKIEEPGRLKDRVDEAWQSVKAGLVRAVSIGFRSIEHSILDDGGMRFTEWEWLELSLVTIPAQASATITTIRSIDTDLRAASGREEIEGDRREPPPALREKSKPVKLRPKEGTKMKPIAEQIADWEAKRAAHDARMNELMEKAAEAGTTLDEEQEEEYDGLAAEVKKVDEHLTRLRALERSKAVAAKPVNGVKTEGDGGERRAGVQIKLQKPLEKGIEFTRFAICVAASKGNIPQALEIAKTRYPENEDIITSLKDAVSAGTTLDSTWAAPLVDTYQRFAGDFVEFLRPQTIIGKFGNNGIPGLRRVPFNISIPGQTSGGDAYWVGEGAPKPLTNFDFTTHNLRWAKVAAIAVLTQELIRFSSPSAEMLVRDALAAAIIARLDTDFIDPDKAAVSNVSPASITNGITSVASTGNDADDIREDVRALMGAYIAANITPTTGVWIMSATTALSLSLMLNALGQQEFPGITMNGGTFLGLPVIVSEYVPTDSDGKLIVLVNASDIWLADDGQVMIDASREASLEMLTNPTNNSATPTATSMVSMFQTNSVALRAERFINWQLRRPEAVQVLGNAQWGEAA